MLQSIHYLDYYIHLERSGRDALAVFSSKRCGSCRRVLDYLSQSPPIPHIFVVEAESATGLIEEFEIYHLPTLLLYKNGYFHANLAVDSPSHIATAIQTALAAPPQETP